MPVQNKYMRDTVVSSKKRLFVGKVKGEVLLQTLLIRGGTECDVCRCYCVRAL